jgi:hypothetical protein
VVEPVTRFARAINLRVSVLYASGSAI